MVTWDWWRRRTQVERVVAYTLTTVYVLYWLLLLLTLVNVVNTITSPRTAALTAIGTLVLGLAGTLVLRDSIGLHPDKGPLPWQSLSWLIGLVVVATSLAFLLPNDPRAGTSLVILSALAWGAGGLLDTRVRNGVLVASAVIAGVLGEDPRFAVFGVAMAAFLLFSLQSSLWLMGVVTSLERARDSEAALAVARERLRFSQDVHDVMGRRLSTIAVQAELAATLAERGDARATEQVLEIRATAHDALREARELARGYRPLDLPSEIDGAVSLLASAGIAAHAEVDDVPPERHESVARVIREAVTNVLRHSRAAHVELTYAGDQLVVSNDGVLLDQPASGDGSGLRTLADRLAASGAQSDRWHRGRPLRRPRRVRARRHQGHAMIRVLLADDEHLIRVALAQMLDLEDDITVVGQAATGPEAVARARALRPDVAVLDLQMPGLDGIAAAAEIAEALPTCGCLIVTSHGRPGLLKRALSTGVRGFLPKTTSAQTLAAAVRAVAAGGRYVDPGLAAEAMAIGDSPAHRPRERRSRGRRRRSPGRGDRPPYPPRHRHRAELPLQRCHEARRQQPPRSRQRRAAHGLDLILARRLRAGPRPG